MQNAVEQDNVHWDFWGQQALIKDAFKDVEDKQKVAVVYGGPLRDCEQHFYPPDDVLRVFVGPFPGAHQSKAVRVCDVATLDKHNESAFEHSLRWCMAEDFSSTYFAYLDGMPELKEHVFRLMLKTKEPEPYYRKFLVLHDGGPFAGGLWPTYINYDIRAAGTLQGWCIDEVESNLWFRRVQDDQGMIIGNLSNATLLPKFYPHLCVQVD
jgi:hypothetical protein